MKRSFFCLVLMFCFFFAAHTLHAERYALLVGLNRYDPAYGATPLSCCINDVVGIRQTLMLSDPNGSWKASNIALATDASANKSAIRYFLQTAAMVLQPGDLLVYAQSSHGGRISGMDAYLCTYNASYTDFELAEDLALFDASVNVIIIVDACFSGGLFKEENPWPFAERTMAAYHAIKERQYRTRGEAVPRNLGANIAFMTACAFNEYSYEGQGYGVYIGCLLEACARPAADTNGNGQYDFLELHNYAAVNALKKKPQHAQHHNPELLGSIQARTVSNGANLFYAYAWADNGLSHLTHAYNTHNPKQALTTACTYANYARYYAYAALANFIEHEADSYNSSYAHSFAYYAYLYAVYAYYYETRDAATYYGAVYEYYSSVYSAMATSGQP